MAGTGVVQVSYGKKYHIKRHIRKAAQTTESFSIHAALFYFFGPSEIIGLGEIQQYQWFAGNLQAVFTPNDKYGTPFISGYVLTERLQEQCHRYFYLSYRLVVFDLSAG